MISPELLRQYRFFGQLNETQLMSLAMIAEELTFQDQDVIFEEGRSADALYFLLQGYIDLYFTTRQAFHQADRLETLVCQINPGEPFGISALIAPHKLTATGRSCGTSRMIRMDREGLQKLLDSDRELEVIMLREMSRTAIERLTATRIQLAAALS